MVEEIIEIDQYLDIRTKKKKGTNHVGNCLTCGVEVPWRWNRVESHKRSGKCANQQPEEYALFKRLKSRPSSSQSGDGGSEHNQSTPEALAMYRNLAIQEQSAAIDYVITAQQDEADKLMAAWILQAGVPLTAVESLTFHGLLTVLRPSYSITSTAEELFGKFIEKSGVTRDQSICAMFNGDPVVLVVDGWSAARPDGLISFVLTGRMHERPVLYKVFDGRQVEGQPEAIANEIIKVIEELLHWGSIGALLTDIMPGIKSVWSVIQQRYPSIFISGCFYRIFNSLIKDIIGSDRRFARTIDDCTFVIEFIKQHREQTFHSLSESDKFLSLKPFASDWCLIAENIGRLLAVRDAIRSTGEIVVSGAGDSEHFRELVINSADFWADLNELYVTVLVPVSKIMEEARLDHSYSPSKLFGWFESFKQHQNNPEIVKSIEKHWNDYINDESMVWLLALDPFFFPQAAIIRTENNERLHRALELLFPEPSEANKAQAELVLFYEFLQNDQEMTLAGPMVAAFEWWLIFERTRFPHIANIALRLFSVPSSPALVDWIWRVFDGAISRPDLGDIDRTQLAVTYINHILACGDFKDNTYV